MTTPTWQDEMADFIKAHKLCGDAYQMEPLITSLLSKEREAGRSEEHDKRVIAETRLDMVWEALDALGMSEKDGEYGDGFNYAISLVKDKMEPWFAARRGDKV